MPIKPSPDTVNFILVKRSLVLLIHLLPKALSMSREALMIGSLELAFSLGSGLLRDFRRGLNELASVSLLLSITKTEKPLSCVMRTRKVKSI